jgi:hypothetical protein
VGGRVVDAGSEAVVEGRARVLPADLRAPPVVDVGEVLEGIEGRKVPVWARAETKKINKFICQMRSPPLRITKKSKQSAKKAFHEGGISSGR